MAEFGRESTGDCCRSTGLCPARPRSVLGRLDRLAETTLAFSVVSSRQSGSRFCTACTDQVGTNTTASPNTIPTARILLQQLTNLLQTVLF